MPGPTVRRFTWRNNPFSEGGRVIAGVHHAGGVLLPEPDPLYNVPIDAPDIVGLPWERRTYDAWTTDAFRDLVKQWLVASLAANPWVRAWHVRERATQARMTMVVLRDPVLTVTWTRAVDGRVFVSSTSWTARTRDDVTLAQPKLDAMRLALETENALHPPPP